MTRRQKLRKTHSKTVHREVYGTKVRFTIRRLTQAFMMIDKSYLILAIYIAAGIAFGLLVSKHKTPGYIPDDDDVVVDDEEDDDSPARGMWDSSSSYYSLMHDD